jgi:hypothetical protein
MTKILHKQKKNEFDIGQYVNSILRIKSQHLRKESKPFSEEEGGSGVGKASKSVYSGKLSEKLGRKVKCVEKQAKKRAKYKLNKSDNDAFRKSKDEEGRVKNKVLDTHFLNQLKMDGRRESVSQKNQSMVLTREIDEWHRKLRSSIPMKAKNNAGYPRIKLNVFLDQINK